MKSSQAVELFKRTDTLSQKKNAMFSKHFVPQRSLKTQDKQR
jgi:hypothetical protein